MYVHETFLHSVYVWGNAHPSSFDSKINFIKMSFNNFQRKYMSLYAQDKIDGLEFFKDFYIHAECNLLVPES